jgi:RNA polymerase sigma-70 factor, ECF subfamily
MEGRSISLPPRPDDAAILAVLHDDPARGVELLYDHYGRMVYSLTLRIVHDRGTAEEITQDVFVRCWSNIARYDPARGGLAAWLLTIAHHRAIDELRSRRGREQRREVSDTYLGLLAADGPAFDDALVQSEVHKALAELPPAQSEVIRLIFWNGLTRREIAQQLRLPLGTVHTRLRLGMEKLRLSCAQLFRDE